MTDGNDTSDDDNQTKLTVKLFAPMYVAFKRQAAANLLKRDAFLEKVIEQELPHLRRDLEGKYLSARANRYISGQLKRLGGGAHGSLRVVSISVSQRTAKSLTEVVDQHNLVRDAFINRLIVLLRASDAFLDAVGLPRTVQSLRRDDSADPATSPMRAIEELLSDPFHYLRAACEERYGCGLNLLELPESLHGFYCYMADDELPDQDREAVDLSALDEQMSVFESSMSTQGKMTTGG